MTDFVHMDDDEREESIIERRDRERLESGKVENIEEIPLFPNVKQDQRKVISSVLVFKTDPPGDGFKGRVSPNSNHETIARLYGNGMYELHAVTPDEKVLRRNTIKVAWQPPTTDTPKGSNGSNGDPNHVPRILDWQAEQHAKDAQRTEAFARMSIEGSQANAKHHIETLASSQAASTERDRAYFAGLQAQQQSFFQSMMQQTQQAHIMAMERSREEFRQTLQLMQISHERAVKATDPTLLFSLFREGIALGAGSNRDDSDDGDSTEPWAAAIQAGASAIKDITEVAKLKAIGAPKLPPALPTPTPPTPATTPSTGKRSTPKKPPFDPAEIAELLRLKAILAQKGMDFSETVRNASSYFVGGDTVGSEAAEPSGDAGTTENAGEPASDVGAADVD